MIDVSHLFDDETVDDGEAETAHASAPADCRRVFNVPAFFVSAAGIVILGYLIWQGPVGRLLTCHVGFGCP